MSDITEHLKDVLDKIAQEEREQRADYKTMPAYFFQNPAQKSSTMIVRLDPDQMRELKLCLLAAGSMEASDIKNDCSINWDNAKIMLEYEPATETTSNIADLRAEIDRLSLMLLEKDQRIAELEKQVPKVRLSARITESGEYEEHLFRVHLLGETFPLVQPFTDKKRASKWCADRGFEVVS